MGLVHICAVKVHESCPQKVEASIIFRLQSPKMRAKHGIGAVNPGFRLALVRARRKVVQKRRTRHCGHDNVNSHFTQNSL
jgi:hypothetical protein